MNYRGDCRTARSVNKTFPGCHWEWGSLQHGNDVKDAPFGFSTRSWQKCSTLCQNHMYCAAWGLSYTSEVGTCYLKTAGTITPGDVGDGYSGFVAGYPCGKGMFNYQPWKFNTLQRQKCEYISFQFMDLGSMITVHAAEVVVQTSSYTKRDPAPTRVIPVMGLLKLWR